MLVLLRGIYRACVWRQNKEQSLDGIVKSGWDRCARRTPLYALSSSILCFGYHQSTVDVPLSLYIYICTYLLVCFSFVVLQHSALNKANDWFLPKHLWLQDSWGHAFGNARFPIPSGLSSWKEHIRHTESPSTVVYICALLVELRPPRSSKSWLGLVKSLQQTENRTETPI